LQDNELALHYQPVHNIQGEVIGAEALLRWTHPQLGPISPEEFVPLAEDIGIIVSIERWVLQQACSDTLDFEKQVIGKFYIAVNISSLQCKSEQCHILLAEALQQSGIDPASITLEITERVMMENTETVMGILREVKSMGVMLAVDDFGTGFSSLSYLKQFPIDVLKIDRAFVAGLPSDRDDVALVEAIVAMAHSLDLEVVAEGVETSEQCSFLQSLGCDQFQGFYFSRALSYPDLIAYLKTQA
jgi:EAL domain-containing protein (putative c-di-GMP-specific phosphodiesterase class I)